MKWSAGDALMFVDAIMHGSAERVKPGPTPHGILSLPPELGRLRYPFKISETMLEAADSGPADDHPTAAAIARATRRGGVRPERPSSKKRRTRGRFWFMPTPVAGAPA